MKGSRTPVPRIKIDNIPYFIREQDKISLLNNTKKTSQNYNDHYINTFNLKKLKAYGSNSETSLISQKNSSLHNTNSNPYHTIKSNNSQNLNLAKRKQNEIEKSFNDTNLKSNEYLYTANSNGKLMKWKARLSFDKIMDYELTSCLNKNSPMYINQVAVSRNRRYLLTLADEHTLLQWDTETDMILRNYTLLNNQVSIKIFCMGQKSHYVFTGDTENRIKQWNINKGIILNDFGIQPDEITMMVVPIGNHTLVTGCKDLNMRQIEFFKVNLPVRVYKDAHTKPINCSVSSPDGLYLFTTSEDRKLKQWSLRSFIQIKDYEEIDDVFNISCMDVSNKGEWLFTGITDGSLIQWSLHKRTVLKRFDRVHDLTLNCIVCTKLYYLTAGGDEILKQFDFTDGKEIKDYGRGNEGEWITTMAVVP